jgi:hypothetical protein
VLQNKRRPLFGTEVAPVTLSTSEPKVPTPLMEVTANAIFHQKKSQKIVILHKLIFI